jgi:hypothetical protein
MNKMPLWLLLVGAFWLVIGVISAIQVDVFGVIVAIGAIFLVAQTFAVDRHNRHTVARLRHTIALQDAQILRLRGGIPR